MIKRCHCETNGLAEGKGPRIRIVTLGRVPRGSGGGLILWVLVGSFGRSLCSALVVSQSKLQLECDYSLDNRCYCRRVYCGKGWLKVISSKANPTVYSQVPRIRHSKSKPSFNVLSEGSFDISNTAR